MTSISRTFAASARRGRLAVVEPTPAHLSMVQSPNVEAGSEVVWSVQVRADADNASLWAVDGREVALRLASELGVRADLYARKYELRFIVTAADAFSASGAALTVWEELVTDLALPAWAVSQVEINATVRVAVTT